MLEKKGVLQALVGKNMLPASISIAHATVAESEHQVWFIPLPNMRQL